MNNHVSLHTLESFNLTQVENAVRECFADICIEKLVHPKMKVLLKVALPEDAHPDRAVTTHPSIVRGIINMLSELDVSVLVADSPYGRYNDACLEEVYLNTGMIEVANSSKCELNRNMSTFHLETPNGVRAKSLHLLEVINEVDAIINVGKIKIDDTLGFMGVCSNMFGLIPGDEKTQIIKRTDNLKDYNNYIIDIIDALQDKLILNIADAVVAVEKGDTQRMLSCIGMSVNPYALDSAFIQMIGMELKDTIIKQADARGRLDIAFPHRMVGEKLEKFIVEDFALPDQNEDTKLNLESELKQKVYFRQNIERPTISDKTCKGCAVCSKICPTNAIVMRYDKRGELYAEIDYKKCIYCMKCYTACPYSVVKVKSPLGHKQIHRQIEKYNKKNDA